ncbi:MAG TPA: F0F1 ATP synthase subunit B [Spirochaetia bacterium]|nr:F0F1 ATP synthase subunit B [Spirochaetia bacterium]
MGETLGRFGIDPILLAGQILNFLVIAWVLYRFLLKPLQANMKARSEKIAQGLKDAEASRRALEEAGREKERLLAETYAQSSRILERARDEAERLRAAALERARADAERMLREARGQLALERQEMERQVQELSLELSGKILESVVVGLFSEDEKSRIVAEGMKRIRAVGVS